jgi:antitoxin (DNA-binding transcriptional repressor) of toxin-antitoxin stability system
VAGVTVREFSYNPSAMFARVERGETIEVTKHGRVIAILVPSSQEGSRYAELVAQGAIRKAEANLSARGVGEHTRIEVPEDVDPLAILLEMRAEER